MTSSFAEYTAAPFWPERALDDADAPERNIGDAGPDYKRHDEPSNNVHQRYRYAQQPVWIKVSRWALRPTM